MIGIELYIYSEAGDAMVARNVFFCAGRKRDITSTTELLMLMITRSGGLAHMADSCCNDDVVYVS